MQKRKLGKSDLNVAPLAFGGNVFGWTADERTSHQLLDAFVDAGLNLVDTADVYSRWIPGNKGGESETIIGTWFKKSGKRDRVILATKLGVEMEEGGKGGLSPAYINKAVERSLERLQTDYIDLYQAHRDDPDTPQEQTLEAFAGLIKAGKVRAIGASNFSADRLKSALKLSAERGLPRYASLQPWYNLYDRTEFEKELAAICKAENVAVISYFSLASGFLTGKYRSAKDLEGRPRAYRVKDMMNERGMRILSALDAVAKEAHATPAQVALAWLIHRGVTAPIASATSVAQLQELKGATELELGKEMMERLNAASA
jgi:aryl-alcohol dehydrogenase-like predicted oxidoreductase